MKIQKASARPQHLHHVARLSELPSHAGKPGPTFSSHDFRSQDVGAHSMVIGAAESKTTSNVNLTGAGNPVDQGNWFLG